LPIKTGPFYVMEAWPIVNNTQGGPEHDVEQRVLDPMKKPIPRLYVADTYNHRILGFKDVRKLKAGVAADIVIGEPDMSTSMCNYPTGDFSKPTQSSVCLPIGLLVDPAGNLYVADSGNGRVIRFPTPFSHTGNQVADLVLGQADFFSRITDAGNRNMSAPYGLAFAGTNGLLVSDADLNRVLYFPFTNGAFTGADNGKAILFVGIEEKGAAHFEFRTRPAGEVRLPADIVEAYRQFLTAVEAAARRRLGVGGCPSQSDVAQLLDEVVDPFPDLLLAAALSGEVAAAGVPRGRVVRSVRERDRVRRERPRARGRRRRRGRARARVQELVVALRRLARGRARVGGVAGVGALRGGGKRRGEKGRCEEQ